MLSAIMQVKGKRLKRSGATEKLEPRESKGGRDQQAPAATAFAPDAVDTLPMTESQVAEAFSAVSDSQPAGSPEPVQDGSAHEAGVDEEEYSGHLQGENEQVEEEQNTDDEIVEPVMSHELAESMEEQAACSNMDTQAEQDMEEKTDRKGPEETKETPTDTKGPHETTAEVHTETAQDTQNEPAAPLSPLGASVEVVDSDEDAKHTKRQKKSEGQEDHRKGTHKDSWGQHQSSFLISDFVFSSMSCHTMAGPNCFARSSSQPR